MQIVHFWWSNPRNKPKHHLLLATFGSGMREGGSRVDAARGRERGECVFEHREGHSRLRSLSKCDDISSL